MATGPSPRVRQEFRKYLTSTVASEGEPAALGKSASGPVYYTDYDSVVHKNRVWFRKGANKEIIGVARADNQGLPDVPNLPIRVARRFGGNWVVDWQRENAAVPTGGGGTTGGGDQALILSPDIWNNGSGATFQENGSGVSPINLWSMPTGVFSFIRTGIPLPLGETDIKISVFYRAPQSGDIVLTGAIRGLGVGEPAVGSWHGGTAYGGTASPTNTNGVQIFTDTITVTTITAGEFAPITLQRTGTDAADTNTGSLLFVGMMIEFITEATGGTTSTTSGVHKFSPAQMLAAQNASETSVNSLATPAIAIPDSGATPTINVAFLAEKTSATLDIDIYAVTASGSGDVVLDADAYSGATDGTGTPTDNNGFVTDGTFAADGNIRKFSLTVAFTTQPDLAPGDYCSARIQRLVASGDDTLAADLHVLMIVVTENGDG